ncbi:hypothetical protein EGT07_00360 [Herbaspirillum sp. HC18]|nr:hypothetical protein EGT07_00360 [Herbaspirillum sp. HC18]
MVHLFDASIKAGEVGSQCAKAVMYGEYLNAFEDTFAHRRYDNRPIAVNGGITHAVYGHFSDRTYNETQVFGHDWLYNEDRSLEMEHEVFDRLSSTWGDGKSQSHTWEEIEPLLIGTKNNQMEGWWIANQYRRLVDMNFFNLFTKRWDLALGFTILIATSIFTIFFFTYLRYLPPMPKAKIDQVKNLNLIRNRTGLILPEKSKILVASDGEPRDGTTGFFYWVIFSEDPINAPQKKSDREYKPDLAAYVRTLENEIAPHKIKSPNDIRYVSWKFNDVDSRMNIISAQSGSYILLETHASK